MATPRTARRAALVLVGAVALAFAPVPAGAEEPTTAAAAAALVAARGHELEVLTEDFNEAREEMAGQQAAAQAAAAAVTEAERAVTAAQDAVVGVARSAFTGESMGSFRAMMTSGSADEFVDRVTLLQAVAGHQGELLERAVAAGEAAGQARVVAERAAGEAQRQYDAVARQQADLQAQITAYQADYARLSAEERRAALDAAAAAHAAGEGGRASRTEREEPEPAAAAPAPVSVASGSVQAVVDRALAQRGKPYVWAAAGPGSFDCSGLVQYAFAAAGVDLPHSSRMQSAMGAPVSRSEARAGDLVAFYSPISHIGIYLGDGRMVHAPTSGDVVKVSSVDVMGATPKFTRVAV
ncbi:Cell wall-associated hydrolase, NlpC family [Geodermatophilus pulveris]|uniref:Cell wall-associated hydrolase, NlpC family n=1 Tax=Geodermatophilus pulveris TaxID=1564159 RepID=A0A239HX52_9ACTN|nr:C40 family peptidase [Geodermatophilus pulveris]SNS85907.1 Cell wall-associated hydrolase, NlpC family [Geodermatophilus pulveris]